jgi:hypothetical protein
MKFEDTPHTSPLNSELPHPRRSTETKVTFDLSGIPAKAQQAISAWLSESDQQAIVDALSAMARRVDQELLSNAVTDASLDPNQAAEIMVIPSIPSAHGLGLHPHDSTRDAA